jgi:hypothetical protein
MAPATADPKVLVRVKSIATRAINAAAVEQAKGLGGDVNRSTATRAAYKIKAEALDEIGKLLGSQPRKVPSVTSARPSRASAKSGVRPRPKAGATAKKSSRARSR